MRSGRAWKCHRKEGQANDKSKLAIKAGIPIPTICSAYTRGRSKPTTVGRIAMALGVDVTEILSDEDEKEDA